MQRRVLFSLAWTMMVALLLGGRGCHALRNNLYSRPNAVQREEPILKATTPRSTYTMASGSSESLLTTALSMTNAPPTDGAIHEGLATDMPATASPAVGTTLPAVSAESSAPTEAEEVVSSSSASSSSSSAPPSWVSQSPASHADVAPAKRRVVTYDQRQEGQYNVRADLENFMIILIPPSSDGPSMWQMLRRRQNGLSGSVKRSKLKQQHQAALQAAEEEQKSGIGPKYQNAIKIGQQQAPAQGGGGLLSPQAYAAAAAQNYPLMPPVSMHASQFPGAQVQGEGHGQAQRQGQLQQQQAQSGPSSAASGWPTEFIEGRTPYRVDISASDDEQSHLHLNPAERRSQSHPVVVDVLPPPLSSLPYQHLIKPYHLEAEPLPTLQALPPQELKRGGGGIASQTLPAHASGNFLEKLLGVGFGGGVAAASLEDQQQQRGDFGDLPDLGKSLGHHQQRTYGYDRRNDFDDRGYYRVSRAVYDQNFVNSNRLASRNSVDGGADPSERGKLAFRYPIYRSELSLGAAQLYPPLDTPLLNGGERLIPPYITTFQGERDDHGERFMVHDGLEQHLDDEADDESRLEALLVPEVDDAIEIDAKELLSDGIERCAPGQRRDSYGMCREIEGY